ncbi:SH3 domain-containing protein [Cytophagaceae bacterium YF14B1]|uniref:SH3 domain-containing protein n=1 Tax=Xanthocytophaga flava TaxID=3048013 RepID=A0AAE3QYQ1_9BACT|nr:SH3 domain-containing protein [Xanthocytophaga flavus]MDJ1485893.1 SH3 domain-containing protein [Xanthocytophaga flavus]
MKRLLYICLLSLLSITTGVSQSSWPSVNLKPKCYGDGPTYYTTRQLEMFESMSMESAVMRDVPKGAAVLVTNSFFGEHGWWEVCYQGQTGWVSKVHLTRKRITQQAPASAEQEDDEPGDDEPGDDQEQEPVISSTDEGFGVGFNPFLAQVSKMANFRSAPSTRSIVIRQLPIRTQLYVFSDQTTNEFYKVIDIQTGKIGWVSKSLIRRTGDADINYSGAFQSTGSTSEYNSEVIIRNKSSRKITLIVGEQTYTLAPHSAETKSLAPGKMHYVASAAGVIPTSGYQTFGSFQGYQWEFWIETR